MEIFLIPKVSKNLSLGRRAPVGHHLEVGHELLDFLLPVVKGRGRRDDQERAPDVCVRRKKREKIDKDGVSIRRNYERQKMRHKRFTYKQIGQEVIK